MHNADKPHPNEEFVIVYEALTREEAAVLRGLLESAGIETSPSTAGGDPFPLRTFAEGTHGTEIVVPKSQAEEARRILKTYEETGAQRP
jgi:hypothetical protein